MFKGEHRFPQSGNERAKKQRIKQLRSLFKGENRIEELAEVEVLQYTICLCLLT